MPTLGLSVTKAGGIVSSYERDGLKLYMPFNSPKEVSFVGQGSTSFDGDNDKIDCDSGLPFGADVDFSISAWAYLDTALATDDYPTIFAQANWESGTSGVKGFRLYKRTASNETYFSVGDGTADYHTQTIGSTDEYDNAWHHFTVTRNTTTDIWKVYVDGVNTDTVAAGEDYAKSTVQPFTIGYGNVNTGWWGGKIKNVGVWGRTLSPTEIQNVMHKTYIDLSGTLLSGIVSWWALDDINSYK